jgi:nicotinate-nucleotide adenylyltransferase
VGGLIAMRIGIFGGTFDPPHFGHLILAEDASQQLGLDQVLWVLTPFPPHKTSQKISPVQDRMTMVLLAISGNTKFRLSRADIDREPPHYAADTVAILREKSPKDEFIYLMGTDSLNDLLSWHEPKSFVALCHGIGVMMRQEHALDTTKLELEISGLDDKLRFIYTPVIDISGSDIRNRVIKGESFRYHVPDKVHHYILNHKLYQL